MQHPNAEPGGIHRGARASQMGLAGTAPPTPPANPRPLRLAVLTVLLALLGASACRLDMHDQPRYEPLEASDFFADKLTSRHLVPGTVARGQLRLDEHFYTGRINGQLAGTIPLPASRELLERGRQRYDIFCAPCHGLDGYGRGMIVRRGFRQPPSFHTDRLRQEPPGHFFDVMSKGFGVMYSYASRIKPEDRWAIVAYVRALQWSQNATETEVPAPEMEELRRSEP